MFAGPQNAWRDTQLEMVLSGNVNAWIPDLLPSREAYLNYQRQALMNYCQFLANQTKASGRVRWGCKLPGWQVPQLSFLMSLLPEAKVIYIYRDLEECVVSSRKINMCLDEPSTQQFRQFYNYQQAEAERRLRNDRVLWIDYQELVDHPQRILEQLADFTGVAQIDPTVMDVKVDNYR